jgi:LytS/YehU family sensor histidine kinase
MLMIPFVENAFKHGVGMVLDPVIDILLKITETDLSFSVRNKIAPESSEDKDMSSGIGLKNVKRRLELLYPNAHHLDIKNDGDWFEVNLNLRFLNTTKHDA